MNNIKIGIASDHRGFTAKEFLKEYFDENDIYVIDFGTNSAESVDFPVYAKKLGEAIQNEEIDLGIAIFNSFCHTFSKVSALISIPQFQSVEFSGGSTAGCCSSSDGTVCQNDLCLYGRISSGIQDLSSDYFFNL